ncbi:hypothetical protein GQL56_21690 [Pseudomonas putida]|nr:hypothetical protein [Pseudomonas putida]
MQRQLRVSVVAYNPLKIFERAPISDRHRIACVQAKLFDALAFLRRDTVEQCFGGDIQTGGHPMIQPEHAIVRTPKCQVPCLAIELRRLPDELAGNLHKALREYAERWAYRHEHQPPATLWLKQAWNGVGGQPEYHLACSSKMPHYFHISPIGGSLTSPVFDLPKVSPDVVE